MDVYYPVGFTVGPRVYYCIWFSGERDGFITESSKVRSFPSLEELHVYAATRGIALEEGETIYSVDPAMLWLHRKGAVNCSYFNGFWNMVSDMSSSLGLRFYGDRRTRHVNRLYDKLFYGLNLPALRGDGEFYIPRFSKKDIAVLVKVVKDGLKIISNFLM